jgi:large subunit ribosomal protein L10
MSLSKKEKDSVVSAVSEQAAKAQTLALAEYRGLTVEKLNELRILAREKGVYLHVLKNTLARRVVAGTPFEGVSGSMVGPLIYGFSEDAIAAAKVLSDFAKTNDRLVIRAGSYGGQHLDAAGVEALARLPSREILLARLAGALRLPIKRLAATVAAVAIDRARCKALQDDQESGSTDPIAIARNKGLEARRQILNSSEMLGLTEVALALGVAVSSVKPMLAEGLFFAVRLDDANDLVRFPKWQFDSRLLPWMPEFLRRFAGHDGWAVRYFFNQPSLLLGEMSPLEYLGIDLQVSHGKVEPSSMTPRSEEASIKMSAVLRSADYMLLGQE